MDHSEKIEERSAAFVKIFLLSNKMQSALDAGLGDLSAKQWLMLAVLSVFEEAPRLKALAQACGITHQSAKQLALKLEAKGYISIGRDRADKRALRIAPTQKCRDWYEKHGARNKLFIERLFSPLREDEIDAFLRMQELLIKNAETIVNECFEEFACLQ